MTGGPHRAGRRRRNRPRAAREGSGGASWAASRLGREAGAGPTAGRERGGRPAGPVGQLGRARGGGGGWAEMGGEGGKREEKYFPFSLVHFLDECFHNFNQPK
jgi:hypothetical protein